MDPLPSFSNETQAMLLEFSRICLKSGQALHCIHFLARDSHVHTVVLLQSADKVQTSADFFSLDSVMQEVQQENQTHPQEHNELK